MRVLHRLLVVSLLAGGSMARPVIEAQVRPVYDLGAAGLIQVLERLQTVASILHVGAHPDDEDSALLARLARGDRARTAYLSLTRGEGGQNIIGRELFEALGVIRTEELLQARVLDGGEQFFTRAIDYGFSKTRDEASRKWDEREVLGDLVRIIRTFRPLIITSRFTGTPADGHGQHQLAGYLTPLAFRAAGDPNQFIEHFAEGLRPWQPRKLYQSVPAAVAGTEVDTGAFDPVLGRSYAEIAAEGRSQHKSQEMGTIERRGFARSYLLLIDDRVGAAPRSAALFDGIDTSLRGIPQLTGLPPGAIAAEIETMTAAARAALEQYEPLRPAALVPVLARGLRAVRDARGALREVAASESARAEADFLLGFKEDEFSGALRRAAAIVVDALASAETVAPRSRFEVTVRTFYPDRAAVRVVDAALTAPDGWSTTSIPPPSDAVPAGEDRAPHREQFAVVVPADAPLTQPYFLREPRDGDRYRWPATSPKGGPFDPPVLQARVTFETGGVTATAVVPVQYRFADQIRGEVRRNVHVVPSLAVSVDSPQIIVPLASPRSRHRLVVTAVNFDQASATATLRLRMPAGWTATPAESTVTLPPRGGRASMPFLVTAPARLTAGTVAIAAEAVTDQNAFAVEMQAIAYPHIQTHRLYRPAAVSAHVLDLKVAPVRVGYVMGSGDQVPDALRRMGVDVTVLDDQTLATGELSSFDTIVVGIRASEARPQFPSENARLLQYVERGGTLIVQYQQTDYVARSLPPYPAFPPTGRGNSRVTDETAGVRILAPDHPVFTFPNRITAADFEGWVQERNLYAFASFDERYVPLLECADSGEPPQRGGQVYADVGRGRYVYTSYAWFRQLPAGVPGAYRQFANLISLARAPRTAGSRGAGAALQTGGAPAPAADRTRPSR